MTMKEQLAQMRGGKRCSTFISLDTWSKLRRIVEWRQKQGEKATMQTVIREAIEQFITTQ